MRTSEKDLDLKNNKIIIVPPNGENIAQDFALQRIVSFLKSKNLKTYLLQIDNKYNNKMYTDYVINVNSRNEIIDYLKRNDFDLIIHRSWMHRYAFAAELAEEFDNIIVYIKDWHNYPKEKYKFIYKTEEDFLGIEKLFKSGKQILTHFTDEQYKVWAERYNISGKYFSFFPEYCTKENFCINKQNQYDKYNPTLVMAGTLSATSEPSLIPGKSFYRKVKEITNCNIEVNVVLLSKFYDLVQTDDRYKDYMYEDMFNDYFSIKLGKEMDPTILEGYDFGIFNDTFYGCELINYAEHYEYAVISRLVLYLEAGLPIIVNKSMKAIANIVKEHKIGIIFEDGDVVEFDKIINLSQENYKQMVENVYTYREIFSYNEETMKPILEMLK